MFDSIAPSELLIVGIVALVVIGPKDLPKALRMIGRWVGKARAMSRHFRSGFDTMMREAELEEMEKDWRAHNEAIMRAYPDIGGSSNGATSEIGNASPTSGSEPGASEASTNEAIASGTGAGETPALVNNAAVTKDAPAVSPPPAAAVSAPGAAPATKRKAAARPRKRTPLPAGFEPSAGPGPQAGPGSVEAADVG